MNKKFLQKLTTFFTAAVIAFGSFGAVGAEAFNFTPVKGYDSNENLIKLDLNSESAYMVNLDTDTVLIDVESNKQRVPASLTKIMTAIILLDEFGGDKEKMKSTEYSAGNEAFDELYGTGASTADIQPFEKVSALDLLYALMLPSACEAANVIAIGTSGSIDKFVDKMNAKAKELKMDDTHFSNAHGLSGDNNYSTCADIAKMCKYAIDNYELFTEVVSTFDYTMSPTEFHPDGTYIYNTNFMLNPDSLYNYSYCKGIKTGTLDSAGRCLASYAVHDGVRYMVVTMGAPMSKKDQDVQKGIDNPNSVYANDTVYYNLIDHINLYEWAYEYVEETKFVDKNNRIREAKVEFGEDGRDYVTLKPEKDYRAYFPNYVAREDIKEDIKVYDNVVAPVYKGDKLGELTLTYNDEVIAEIPLIAADSVNRSKPAEKAKIAKSFPYSTPFKVAVVVIILFAVTFTVLHIMRVQKKYMKK